MTCRNPSQTQTWMRRIDARHLAHPFAGSRMLRGLLAQEGCSVGRRPVTTRMHPMGLTALYRGRNPSTRHAAHPVYLYLLRNRTIERPNLAWRCSQTRTTDCCITAVEEAITRYGSPEIFNTDQGSECTDSDCTDLLKRHGIQISRNGKGSWRDNVFVERLWRTVKYEEVYLHAYDSMTDVQTALTRYFTFYNSRRPHSTLDGKTRDSGLPQSTAARRLTRRVPLIFVETLFREAAPPLFLSTATRSLNLHGATNFGGDIA